MSKDTDVAIYGFSQHVESFQFYRRYEGLRTQCQGQTRDQLQCKRYVSELKVGKLPAYNGKGIIAVKKGPGGHCKDILYFCWQHTSEAGIRPRLAKKESINPLSIKSTNARLMKRDCHKIESGIHVTPRESNQFKREARSDIQPTRNLARPKQTDSCLPVPFNESKTRLEIYRDPHIKTAVADTVHHGDSLKSVVTATRPSTTNERTVMEQAKPVHVAERDDRQCINAQIASTAVLQKQIDNLIAENARLKSAMANLTSPRDPLRVAKDNGSNAISTENINEILEPAVGIGKDTEKAMMDESSDLLKKKDEAIPSEKEPHDIKARPIMDILQTDESNDSLARGTERRKLLDFVFCGCFKSSEYAEI